MNSLGRYLANWGTIARRLLTVGAAALVIVALGCTPWGRGTYQVELFSEMHYSQAYKSQEPPRLAPPSGAVPFASFGEGRLIASDYYITGGYQKGSESAKALYVTNCAFCHGIQGKGDGAVKDYLLKWGGIPPADITGGTTSGSSDQEILDFIGYGGRVGYFAAQGGAESPSPMPTFNKLLTPEEQWDLVGYVRDLQGK